MAFIHVYEHSNILQAAKALNCSQPVISQKIKKLETITGHTLFERTNTGVIPTSHAKLLYAKTSTITKSCNQIIKNLDNILESELSDVIITTTRAVAAQWLIQALPEFFKDHQEINLKVIGDDNVSNFQHYNCDVAIQPYLDNNPNCIQKFLLKCHVRLYASSEYLEEHGTPETVEDLLDHKIIAYTEKTNLLSPYESVNWHLSLVSHREKLSPYLTVNSSDGLQRAAMANLGIISMSQEAIDFNQLPLKRVLPEVNGPVIDLYFSTPKSLEEDKTINALYDTLKKFLTQEVAKQ